MNSYDLEKRLRKVIAVRKNSFNHQDALKILGAYEFYGHNIKRTSRELSFGYQKIRKMWKDAGFKISSHVSRERKLTGPNKKTWDKYSSLINEGLSRPDIAKRLDCTRQAVSIYFQRHPELSKLYRGIHRNNNGGIENRL